MANGFGLGLANFMQNYQQGIDHNREVARQAKSDAWAQEAHDQLLATTARQNKAAAQDDALQSSLTKVNAPVISTRAQEGPQYQDEQGVTTPLPDLTSERAPTQDEQFDRAASAYSTRGDPGNAAKFTDAARAERMRRSSEAFNQVYSGSQGKDLKGLIDQSVQVFNADPGVANLENVRYDDKGGVTFDVFNKQTQKRISKTFADPRQLLNDLHSYYAPESWAAMEKARQASEMKVSEERSKQHVLRPGDVLGSQASGITKNDDLKPGFTWEADANGNRYQKPIGKTGVGGIGTDTYKLSNDAWELANKGETKLGPEMLLPGARLTQELVTNGKGKVPPALAAEVAHTVLADPKKVEPSIDNRTGRISGVFQHPTRGEFVIDADTASATNPGKFTPEQLTAMTSTYLSKLPATDRAGLVAAAFDVKARNTMVADINTTLEQAAKEQLAKTPGQERAVQAWLEKAKSENQAALKEKLALVSKYSTPPPATKDGKQPPTSLGGKGGIFPAGYTFLSAPRLNYLETQQASGALALTAKESAELKQLQAAKAAKAQRRTGWFGEDLGD